MPFCIDHHAIHCEHHICFSVDIVIAVPTKRSSENFMYNDNNNYDTKM